MPQNDTIDVIGPTKLKLEIQIMMLCIIADGHKLPP
jgi:hypothetical protein